MLTKAAVQQLAIKMVNHGVSFGCRTCKKRRKKCDEARPSCTRCIKAKLICPGYENQTDLKFRNSGMKKEITIMSPPDQSDIWQGLCRLTIDHDWIRDIALVQFLDDYCVTPSEDYLSRGFLSGLRKLLERMPKSEVVKAAETAALASLATKQGDEQLSQRAKRDYTRLLSSFSLTMSKPETATTLQSLTTAVLMGTYEMISASKSHPGNHIAHCRGVAAILSSKSPVFRKHLVRKFWPEDDTIKSCDDREPLIYPDLSMIKMSDPGPVVPSLDTLLQTYSPVFRTGKLLTSNLDTSNEELRQFRDYAITVDQEFSLWPARQPLQWQPRTLGLVDTSFRNGLLPGLTSSPTHIDVYLDVYVSSIWNAFRKCRLVLLDFISQCSVRLQLQGTDTEGSYGMNDIFTTAKKISEDIAASIPFHLVRNPMFFVQTRQEDQNSIHKQSHITPNISAGGLIIMHTMFVVSTISIVPGQTRQSFVEYLGWIGKTMGIGHAEVIADKAAVFVPQRIHR